MNTLEPQHVKIVDMFSYHKICIKFLEEVQRYFRVVVRGNIKNHVPYVHRMVFNWLIEEPLNGNMCFANIWNAICPKHSKLCIYVLFGYFELLNIIVAQSINIFFSFCLSRRYYAIQSIIESTDGIHYGQ